VGSCSLKNNKNSSPGQSDELDTTFPEISFPPVMGHLASVSAPGNPHDTCQESASKQQGVDQNVHGREAVLAPCYESQRLSSFRPVEYCILVHLLGTLLIMSRASLQPYACGHPMCWSVENQTGDFKFSTSKELSIHVKTVHGEIDSHTPIKVFRCALSHCGKSWKARVLFQS
jgi:hypothetical protein